MDYFDEVRHWSRETETGDRAELANLPENISFWSQHQCQRRNLIGQKCPDFEACFITQMRRRAEEADIIIVNHHMFFADLNVRGNQYGKVLPDYGAVIFDEAHLIEDISADYFGFQVSSFQLDELVRDAETLPITDAIATRDMTKTRRKDHRTCRSILDSIYSSPRKDGRFPLMPNQFAQKNDGGEIRSDTARRSLFRARQCA